MPKFFVCLCIIALPFVCGLAFVQYCEICRIYNECLLLHEELLKQNLHLCNNCMQEQYNATFHELIKDYYGQIVAFQHTGITKLHIIIYNYRCSKCHYFVCAQYTL